MVKSGEADAIISAGSSGAILAGGQLIVGRSKGVKRSPLAPLIPTTKGYSLLIDCGANVDARPEHLLQFAKMGSIYMENIEKIEKPRVAIVNIGDEEEKGNALVKETYPLLKECKDINFVGSIEAREIPMVLQMSSYVKHLWEMLSSSCTRDLQKCCLERSRKRSCLHSSQRSAVHL